MQKTEVTVNAENDGVRIGVWMSFGDFEKVSLRAEWSHRDLSEWVTRAGIMWEGNHGPDGEADLRN